MMEQESTGGFLGTGWASPPTFIKGPNTALTTSGAVNVNENLRILLETRLGERPFKPLYGANLHDQMFRPLSDIPQGDLITFLKANIKRFEPRIELEKLTVSMESLPDSKLIISISYRIISVNSRHNFVYPFYLNEGTHVADQ